MKIITAWLFFTATTVFFAIAALIVIDGMRDSVIETDVIVVLGNKVELDGSPSERLKSRLDKAFEMYNQFNQPIVVSGGLGQEGFEEAFVMKEYLISRGVPADLVITDTKGVDTFSTAQSMRAIMADRNFESVTVVSNYYHISRSKLALRNFGIRNISSAHADYYEIRDVYSLAREVIGYLYYLVREYK